MRPDGRDGLIVTALLDSRLSGHGSTSASDSVVVLRTTLDLHCTWGNLAECYGETSDEQASHQWGVADSQM